MLKIADQLIIPIQPSLFDIQATLPFVQHLQAHKRARKLRVGLVAMRVREHTIAADQLQHFLATLDLPVVGSAARYPELCAPGGPRPDTLGPEPDPRRT